MTPIDDWLLASWCSGIGLDSSAKPFFVSYNFMRQKRLNYMRCMSLLSPDNYVMKVGMDCQGDGQEDGRWSSSHVLVITREYCVRVSLNIIIIHSMYYKSKLWTYPTTGGPKRRS